MLNDRRIKAFVMDVDGTLTDGRIYISEEGEVFKAFNVKDGMGVTMLLDAGIIPIIITGRVSGIVEIRAKELGIIDVFQGYKNKLDAIFEVCKKYNLLENEIAVIGDDINDLPMIEVAGLSYAPIDSHISVKSAVNFVCKQSGGDGAVREAIDMLLHSMTEIPFSSTSSST